MIYSASRATQSPLHCFTRGEYVGTERYTASLLPETIVHANAPLFCINALTTSRSCLSTPFLSDPITLSGSHLLLRSCQILHSSCESELLSGRLQRDRSCKCLSPRGKSRGRLSTKFLPRPRVAETISGRGKSRLIGDWSAGWLICGSHARPFNSWGSEWLW
jgi:hypothetical protein